MSFLSNHSTVVASAAVCRSLSLAVMSLRQVNTTEDPTARNTWPTSLGSGLMSSLNVCLSTSSLSSSAAAATVVIVIVVVVDVVDVDRVDITTRSSVSSHSETQQQTNALCEIHSLQGFTSQPKQFQSYFMCIYSIAYKVYKKGRKKLGSGMQEQG